MKIKSFEFSHVKAFKSLRFDLERTSVLIGQNDHGKSSILKAIDIVLNQLNEETLKLGALHPDLAEVLLPIFPVQAKTRRITINYGAGAKEKQLHVHRSFGSDVYASGSGREEREDDASRRRGA